MIFRPKVKVGWQSLKEKCRLQAIANNDKENYIRISDKYKVGALVLIVDKSYELTRKAKLASPTQGSFEILKVYKNGKVRIKRGNYDEDILIRGLQPYRPKATE